MVETQAQSEVGFFALKLQMVNRSENALDNRQLFDPTVSKAIDALYIAVSSVDIFCNVLVCMLFYKDKTLRKPFNILLLNLSLADMASALAIQPFVWIDFTKINGYGRSAGFVCASSVGLLFFISCGLTNILTLCAVTVVRYLGIVKNYQGSIVTSNAIITKYCVLTWLIGFATNIPNALSFQYNSTQAICYRQWPSGINGNLYSMLTTLFFMVIPIVLMITCYCALAMHVWRRSLDLPGSNIAASRARKSVAVLLGFLILAFITCWSPFFTIWILGRSLNYFPKGPRGEYERQRWLKIGMLFALLNSALDPFIYTYSSIEYRKGLRKMLFPKRKAINNGKTGRAFTVSSGLASNLEINQI